MKTLKSSEAWFSFNGVSCLSHNVRMISPPSRPHPARKGRYEDIPGTDGGLWMDEGGYKNIPISVPCVAVDNLNIDDINAWLTGGGDLIFGDEPNRLYHARITGEFARNNLYGVMRGQEFTVSFDCEPYRYKVDTTGDDILIESESWYGAPTVIFYEQSGSVDSLPMIKVENTNGGCVIKAGGKEMRVEYCAQPIYIDCAAKYATVTFSGVRQSASRYISGDWPRLPPASAPESISVTSFEADPKDTGMLGSNHTTVTVSPRWRYL